MTESPTNLTIRIVMNQAASQDSTGPGGYRWDRIILVVLLLLAAGLAAFWLLRSPAPEPVETAAETVPLTGNVDRSHAVVAGLSRPEADPALPVGQPEPVAGEMSKPEPALPPNLAVPLVNNDPASPVAIEAHEDNGPAVAPDPVPTGEGMAAVENDSIGGDTPAAGAGPGSSNTVPAASAVVAGATRIESQRVARFLITDAVVAREPVGAGGDIREDKTVAGLVRVIAFSEVRDLAGEAITYRWRRGEQVATELTIRVASPVWRSYTSKFLNRDMQGSWLVELLAADGELLAVTEFEFRLNRAAE